MTIQIVENLWSVLDKTEVIMSVINYTKTKDLLVPVKNWLNNIEINNSKIAHRICHLIPAQCPFAREIKLGNLTMIKIPPLCKINPLYDELMMLRFRAISYLADDCGEDISAYLMPNIN